VLDEAGQPWLSVSGGNGTDRLRLTAAGQSLDLRQVLPRFSSIEVIDLESPGQQRLSIDDDAVRRIPGNRSGLPEAFVRSLVVLGSADDVVALPADYVEGRSNGGRLTFYRPGAVYGLEISSAVRIERLP
jgi:hypothetical protein